MLAVQLPPGDPAFNLAFEEILLDSIEPDSPGYFLLWRNLPSVIIGRHQNAAAEVNRSFLEEHSIPAVRRISGGGAVYHDAGNLNYSFLLPVKGQKRETPAAFGARLFPPLLIALARFGVKAELSGRNDLSVDGRKISGTAQARRGGAVLLHGAMLVDVDLDALASALNCDPAKYQSKALPSIRSRVCNLREINPEISVEALSQAFLDLSGAQIFRPLPVMVSAAQELARTKYRNWDWNYGASPAFTESRKKRFDWGGVECCYQVRNGRIAACRIYGDYFSQRDIADLEKALIGQSRQTESLFRAIKALPLVEYFSGCQPEELARFLAE